MFCPNCGKKLLDSNMFCTGCGAKVTTSEMIRTPVQPNEPWVQKKKSKGKIIAIVTVAIIATGLLISSIVIAVQDRREHREALQIAQDQAIEAQAAAEQAQKDAETARAEKEQAQKEAEQAKSDARAQAALIMAAINAAQNGDAVVYDGYIFPSDRQYITGLRKKRSDPESSKRFGNRNHFNLKRRYYRR